MEKWENYITTDLKVRSGKPVIKGTRITVDHVLELYIMGWDEEKILLNYTRLNKHHLQAVADYQKAKM